MHTKLPEPWSLCGEPRDIIVLFDTTSTVHVQEQQKMVNSTVPKRKRMPCLQLLEQLVYSVPASSRRVHVGLVMFNETTSHVHVPLTDVKNGRKLAQAIDVGLFWRRAKCAFCFL